MSRLATLYIDRERLPNESLSRTPPGGAFFILP